MLSQFNLVNDNTNNKMQYSYKCGDPQTLSSTTQGSTTPTTQGSTPTTQGSASLSKTKLSLIIGGVLVFIVILTIVIFYIYN